MYELTLIKDTVGQVADAIAAILEMETEIVDHNLQIVSGTGRFRRKIGAYEEGGDLDSPLIYGKVLRSGIDYICLDAPNDPIYRPEENELAEICCPILVGSEVAGLIGLVAFTTEQQEKMVARANIYLNFLREMSMLISGKLVENQSSTKLSMLLESMPEGLIASGTDGKIFYCNFSSELLLEKHRTEIIGSKLTEVFPNDDRFSLLNPQDMFSSYEYMLPLPSGTKHFLITSVPIAHLGTMYLFFDSLRAGLFPSSEYNDNRIFFSDIFGHSESILEAKKFASQISNSNSTVLITGESGTGKELFARAIHNNSSRSEAPFVSINCGAIPETLLESELFGYEKGSFTGASTSGKIGKFELANHGTLFLDEIGDMPFHLQVKLLHFLQYRTVERIGSTKPIPVDVRIIAATNKSLESMIENNEFREDLYFRLNVLSLDIPPLRERDGDLEVLLNNLLRKFNGILGKNVSGFSQNAVDILKKYNWPGNVRELENTIEYCVNITTADYITPEDLPKRIIENVNPKGTITLSSPEGEDRSLKAQLRAAEKAILQKTLAETGSTLEGKRTAAGILGISESTRYRRLREFDLL